ncbi:MAG: S-layer homology domain-containing protein [Firmicutes bacterium]|nr:S-layer homology domain-containing protein [Bacillota bacterium]
MKRVLDKKIVLILIATLIFNLSLCLDIAYADDKADVTLYIHGEKSEGAPIFNSLGNIGDGLWSPGKISSGTLRLYNNYSNRISVSNLGLYMKLEKRTNDGYKEVKDKNLYEYFAKSMKLTVKKGQMLIFKNTLYDKSFYEMLYKEGNESYNGFNLSGFDKFNLNKNDYVDLEYTVHMKDSVGNELQGLKATVDFLINANENPIHHHSDKKDKSKDTKGHWAHDCIETLLKYGIIKGYPDGSIRPENYITRAEAAVLVGRALELEEKNRLLTGYIDIIPTWAEGYILTTTEKNIFKGYPFRLFKANNNITREEMTSVLMRAFKLENEKTLELKFSDKDKISDWAMENVMIGIENDIIEGYPDKTFKPQNSITRAEAFTMICKLLGYHKEHND